MIYIKKNNSKNVPISRSCQGCAATDLLVMDDRILSFRGGCDFWIWWCERDTAPLFGLSIGGAITCLFLFQILYYHFLLFIFSWKKLKLASPSANGPYVYYKILIKLKLYIDKGLCYILLLDPDDYTNINKGEA